MDRVGVVVVEVGVEEDGDCFHLEVRFSGHSAGRDPLSLVGVGVSR